MIQRPIDTAQPFENAVCRWGGANAQMTVAVAEVDQMRYSYLVGLLCDLGLPTHAANDRAVLLTWAFIGRSFVPAFVAETSNSVAHDICADLLSNPKEELHVTFFSQDLAPPRLGAGLVSQSSRVDIRMGQFVDLPK